jgi:cell division inhibitor SepF
MAGAMRKMAVYLGLVEDEDSEEYVYEEEPGERRVPREEPTASRPGAVRRYEARPTSISVDHARTSLAVDTDPYRITTLHPRTYNDARGIGEHFRDGTPVIMNLTEMEDIDAKRLVDFAAGLVFGLRGSIERVTNKVFLLTPANVEVTAEDKARIAQGGFFNQS